MPIPINKASLATQIKLLRTMLITAVLSVFFDQFTKYMVRKTVLLNNESIKVIKDYFHIHYVKNTGAAFGMFRGQNSVFIIVSSVAICFIFVYYRQFKESTWMKISLGLLLGGALGNLIDRVIFHHVTDFISVRVWLLGWRLWPSFNIADASVCIGAVMLIVGMLKHSKNIEGEAQDANGAT